MVKILTQLGESCQPTEKDHIWASQCCLLIILHIIHKQTKNIIHMFIQSIKDVAHHHIVKESKEKADNDDSESKAPDEND